MGEIFTFLELFYNLDSSNSSLITKVLFGYVVMLTARLKYYFAWTFGEFTNYSSIIGVLQWLQLGILDDM